MDRAWDRLAAPCGLYCGACSIRAAYNRKDGELLRAMAEGIAMYLDHDVGIDELACDGCSSETLGAPCRECAIRDCAVSKGLRSCAECDDFPCERLKAFNADGMPHHSEAIRNINRQREIGLEPWISEQADRWRCENCGAATDWYAVQCRSCGARLEGKFKERF